MVKTLPATGLPASVLTIKYTSYLSGLYDLEHYNFHISNLLVATKTHIVHTQCLVEGSILPGVFLTSSFCVVPESSYSSNAAVSSLLVAWSSSCSTAASSTESMVASFKNLHRGSHINRQLFSSRSLRVDYYWVHRKTLSRLRPHRAHIHVVLSHKTPLQQQFYSGYLSV